MLDLSTYIPPSIKKQRIERQLSGFFTGIKKQRKIGWTDHLLKTFNNSKLYRELKGIAKANNVTQEELFKNLSPSNVYYLDGQLTEEERKAYFDCVLQRLIIVHKNNGQRTWSTKTTKSVDVFLPRAFRILYPNEKETGVDRWGFVEKNQHLLSGMKSHTIGSFVKATRKNTIKKKIMDALSILKSRGQKTRRITDMREFYGANFEEDIKEYYGPTTQLRDQFESDFPVGVAFVKPGKEDIKGLEIQQKQRAKEIISTLQEFMFVLEEKKATSWKPIDLRTMKYRKLEKKIVTFYDKAPGNKWENFKKDFGKHITITLLDGTTTNRKEKLRTVDTPAFDEAIRAMLESFSQAFIKAGKKTRKWRDLEKFESKIYKQIQHTYSTEFGEPKIWQTEFIKRYGDIVKAAHRMPGETVEQALLRKKALQQAILLAEKEKILIPRLMDTLQAIHDKDPDKRYARRSPMVLDKSLYTLLWKSYSNNGHMNRKLILSQLPEIYRNGFTSKHKKVSTSLGAEQEAIEAIIDTEKEKLLIAKLTNCLQLLHNEDVGKKYGRRSPMTLYIKKRDVYNLLLSKYSNKGVMNRKLILSQLPETYRNGFTSKREKTSKSLGAEQEAIIAAEKQKTLISKLKTTLASLHTTNPNKKYARRSPMVLDKSLYTLLWKSYRNNGHINRKLILSQLPKIYRDGFISQRQVIFQLLGVKQQNIISADSEQSLISRLEDALKNMHQKTKQRKRGWWQPWTLQKADRGVYQAIARKYGNNGTIAWDYILPLLQPALREGFTSGHKKIRSLATGAAQQAFSVDFGNMETAAARTASTSNNPEDILIQKEAKNDMLTQLSSISIHLSTEEKGRLKMIYAGEDIPTVAFQKLVSVIKKHI